MIVVTIDYTVIVVLLYKRVVVNVAIEVYFDITIDITIVVIVNSKWWHRETII